MTIGQKEKVESALIEIIVRTAEEKKATPDAISALSNVVSSLARIDEINPSHC